jgi:hypothetical protein
MLFAMRRNFYLPDQVRTAIREHVEQRLYEARETVSMALEDEDTATGHVLGLLATSRTQRIRIDNPEVGGTWKWSLSYTKFRSHGPGAAERVLGADGILELSVSTGQATETKCALFQTKMDRQGGGNLLSEAVRLSTWREAAFVLLLTEEELAVAAIDDVVRARGGSASFDGMIPLDTFLNERFLECLVGDDQLRYDARSHRLSWVDRQGRRVALAFRARHRFRVWVEAPSHAPETIVIAPTDLADHLMQATVDELVGVGYASTPEQRRAAVRELAKIYHPDRLSTIEASIRRIAERRIQEVNAAVGDIDAWWKQRHARRREPE